MSTPDARSRRFGRHEIRVGERQVLADGRPLPLGARAFDLLLALFERRHRVVSKSELLVLVWPGLVVEENNLQVQVSTLRRLLGPAAITTIPGRGYSFTAAVDGSDEPPASGHAQASASAPLQVAISLPAVTGNLPAVAPLLFGRDQSVRALSTLIGTQRLVTLAGAGGMGKTALARAVAHHLRERFRDGAWWIDLAPLTEPIQVAPTVAAALQLGRAADGSTAQQLVRALADQVSLLVLDNCEPVIDATAALVESLLEGAPGVHLLVTSQEPLHISAERVWRVDPLALPAIGQPALGGDFGAVQLFAERARSADPRFVLDHANADTVADICRRLDGMPLAIELAAARVPMLGLQRVREALGERFRLLTAGARNAPRRHQTLRATLDWSHALLAEAERVVFRRLGIFVGGFSLGLAQEVADDDRLDDWAVLDALGALVDKSLVVADEGEPVRYRLLETTRAFALEKLADAGETPILMERHARAVAALFLRIWEAQDGEQATLGQAAAMKLEEPEFDNARAALAWASAEVLDSADGTASATAIVLATAVASLLEDRGQGQEALGCMQSWAERIDDDAHPMPAAWFWVVYATLGHSGRLSDAATQAALTRTERIWRQRGDHRRLHAVLCRRVPMLLAPGRRQEADALMKELLALEDPAWPPWVRSRRLSAALYSDIAQGRLQDALQVRAEIEQLLDSEPGYQAHLTGVVSMESLIMLGLERFDEVLALTDAFDSRFGSEHPHARRWTHAHRAFALIFLGRIDEAAQAIQRDIGAWQRDGLLLRYCGHLALLAADQGRLADAARLDGAAQCHQARICWVPDPSGPLARQRLVARFHAVGLGQADLERWRREGDTMDEAALMALCLGEDPTTENRWRTTQQGPGSLGSPDPS